MTLQNISERILKSVLLKLYEGIAKQKQFFTRNFMTFNNYRKLIKNMYIFVAQNIVNIYFTLYSLFILK